MMIVRLWCLKTSKIIQNCPLKIKSTQCARLARARDCAHMSGHHARDLPPSKHIFMRERAEKVKDAMGTKY